MAALRNKGRQVRNRARPASVTASQAKNLARKEIAMRSFNPDYDMVMKRISNVPTNGLRCGAPPGVVS